MTTNRLGILGEKLPCNVMNTKSAPIRAVIAKNRSPKQANPSQLDFTSTISKTTTPSSTENRFLSRTHALLANSPQDLPQELDPASVPGVVDPILSAEGRFKCPKCPRDFAERGKAR